MPTIIIFACYKNNRNKCPSTLIVMKKYIFLFLSITLAITACQKDEEPYVRFLSTSVTLANTGGEETILFETNSSWIANSSETWCTITPSRGGVSSKSTTIKLDANNSYEARTCEVLIVAGGVSKTITITQSQKNAIIVTNKNYELSSDSHTLDVGFEANVDVEVVISENAKGWISTTETRAMTAKTVKLQIAANKNTNEARTTEVYIKDKASDLQDKLLIVQRGESIAPPGVKVIEGDASRIQHLDVSSDFILRLNGLDNKDVYFVFSNENVRQSISLPQLKTNAAVMSRSAKRAYFSEPSFVVSGKPSVTEFNNNPPKHVKGGEDSPYYKQQMISRSAQLAVGSTEYLNDADDKPQLSTVRKKITAHGKNLYVWVANDSWHDGGFKSYKITQQMVDDLATKFLAVGNDNDIYEWVTNATGEHWGPTNRNYYIPETDDIHIWLMDIDGDNKTTGTVTLGYYYARDNYRKTSLSASNEKLMFTIDAVLFAKPDRGAWSLSHFWPSQMISTLAHEFTHMVYFYQHEVLRGLKSNIAINEMSAQCVEDLVANKINGDGPRGVPHNTPSAGYSGNTEGRLPLYNSYNDYTLLDWSENSDETLTNYSKTYALGAYLMRNYGGTNFIRELLQNNYTGAASIVASINTNGGDVKSYGDVLQQFGAASLLSDITDMGVGYRFNKGDEWSKSTINGITYDLGSINLYNYSPTPYIYNQLPTTQKPGSNLFYLAGSNLSGGKEWYFEGVNQNTKITVVIK